MKRIKKRSKKERRGHRTTRKASRRAQANRRDVPDGAGQSLHLDLYLPMAMAVALHCSRIAAKQRR
jgi:pyrroloquinoline quinone (PQQ) biosynthesis protein C